MPRDDRNDDEALLYRAVQLLRHFNVLLPWRLTPESFPDALDKALSVRGPVVQEARPVMMATAAGERRREMERFARRQAFLQSGWRAG
jgi:hypothetical protein